jgi:hypothetical protein
VSELQVPAAGTDETAEPTHRRWLGITPTLFAAGLALLYSVGAVLTVGELRASKLAIRDALPLVPLPQILGRGMSVFLGSLGANLALAGAFGLALYGATFLVRATKDRPLQRRMLLKRHRKLALGYWIAGAFTVALIAPPLASPLLVLATVPYFLQIYDRITVRQAAMQSFLLLWIGILVGSFYYPARLPQVAIQSMGTSKIVRGDLVATSGGLIYVGQRQRGVEVVPAAQARVIHFKSQHHDAAQSLGSVIWRSLF